MDVQTLFAQDPAFADVTPIKQDDGPSPVCPINYSAAFVDSMDYFRAMLQANEISPRSLLVTTRVIQNNAACYTAWYFRRLVLEGLKSDLNEELKFVSDQSRNHPKNYQIWYHRRWLVEKLQNASQELEFTQEILEDDSKNYHSWTHRQWVIKTFKLWDNELEYIEKLLQADVRNNSAWNQRYFFIFHTKGLPVGPSDAKEAEIAYAQTKIQLSPNNECPWNYMLGMTKGSKITEFPSIVTFCKERETKWMTCANLLSALVDIFAAEGDNAKAKQICETLSNSVDNIHKKYWTHRASQL